MLARRDQENLVHAQQTAAAAKPLNQSVRGLAPKTPGNNGRKANRNDENAVTVQVQKGDKAGNTFITPAPNRDRIALGAKTTNAKARAFATPAPLTGGQGLQKTHRRSASTKKAKLKVHHQVEPTEADTAAELSDEEPDIEYFPPPIKELPDGPDEYEFGPDKKFPQFEGDNYSRGWYQTYANTIGPDGMTTFDRRRKEEDEAVERHLEESIKRDTEQALQQMNRDLDEFKLWEAQRKEEGSRPTSAMSRPASTLSSRPMSSAASSRKAALTSSGPSSRMHRDAASALSGKSRPRFAQPTASTQARAQVPTQASPASKATIGYARGRQVSSSIKEAKTRDASSRASGRNIEDNPLVREQRLLDELLSTGERTTGSLDDGFWESNGGKDWFQEQLEADKDFQLEVPEFD